MPKPSECIQTVDGGEAEQEKLRDKCQTNGFRNPYYCTKHPHAGVNEHVSVLVIEVSSKSCVATSTVAK